MAKKLAVQGSGDRWELVGEHEDLAAFNDYLGYLADRRYSPATVRSYAFDLLHFARWLSDQRVALAAVVTETLLRYLADCRSAQLSGQHYNVISLETGRAVG